MSHRRNFIRTLSVTKSFKGNNKMTLGTHKNKHAKKTFLGVNYYINTNSLVIKVNVQNT